MYLKFGLKSNVSQTVLEKRKLRQDIGENFMDWAMLHYGEDGIFLNDKVEKVFATHRYLADYEQDRKFINPRKFKEKLLLFAEYAGLQFNPTTNGERIKSNGREYFILANDQFDANNYATLQSDDDIRNNTLPFNRKI